jgi:Rho GTPase-activating protein 1
MCSSWWSRTVSCLSNLHQSAQPKARQLWGLIIKFCIQHYYEIFDEIQDRSEAVPPKTGVEETASSSSSSPQQTRFSAFLDDVEIDGAMLVMPIGPEGTRGNGTAPSA